MQKDFWLDKWQRKDTGFNQDEPNAYLRSHYDQLQLKPDDSIFVPLCGKSVDMLWLKQKGHQVIGVELSPIACRDFFIENNIPFHEKKLNGFSVFSGDRITIYCGDFFDLTPELIEETAAVYDRACLIALPEDIREKYVSHLSQLISAGTKILLATIRYDENQMAGPPFSISNETVKKLYHPNFTIEHLIHRESNIPSHLQAKGLQSATDDVYLITKST